jgi:antitoxin YefM
MEIVNFTEARQNFKSVLDRVTDNVDCAIVVRRGGDDAVIMSKSHYDSIMETLYLLRSPVNAARLRESIVAVEAGEIEEHDLIDEVASSDLTSEACDNRA